jgi:glutathione-regulated potassium-efflux system protein KefB
MNGQPNEYALLLALVLLGAVVISVPIARGLRLSAIVAYLAAGVVIGPFGVRVFSDPQTILAVADLGIVLLLFLIGIELELSRLRAMQRAIFGLGAAQLVLTTAVLAVLAFLTGLAEWRGAIIASLGLAMSGTAIALKILEERGELQRPYGQRAFAILLFQDISVVPVLALLPLLAPGGENHAANLFDTLMSVVRISVAIAAIVVAGRYLLNPFMRLLAWTGAREVMTAAALLVVFGAAELMQAVGMSMALGAFLAGVLLAESNYRHELEADIEPFRGLLLALFFMGVGMSIDMRVVAEHIWLILTAAIVITALKMGIVGVIFRTACPSQREALEAGSVLTAAGEFSFVLIPLGASYGALATGQGNLFSAIAAATMMIGPPVAALTDMTLRRFAAQDEREADDFEGAHGSVLMVGFGRFGQVASQALLAEGVDVTALDNNAERIKNATRFGFKVYYGDGTRLDVLRAAGAGNARLIAVCVDNPDTADKVVALVKAEFPGSLLYVRSFDRGHSLRLLAAGVDFEKRETVDSAFAFGRRTLEGLGLDPERAALVDAEMRERDGARLVLQQAEGIYGGLDMLITRPVPEPLSIVRREAKRLNPDANETVPKDAVDKADGNQTS